MFFFFSCIQHIHPLNEKHSNSFAHHPYLQLAELLGIQAPKPLLAFSGHGGCTVNFGEKWEEKKEGTRRRREGREGERLFLERKKRGVFVGKAVHDSTRIALHNTFQNRKVVTSARRQAARRSKESMSFKRAEGKGRAMRKPPPATKPSLANGQLLTSTGVDALDHLFGKGVNQGHASEVGLCFFFSQRLTVLLIVQPHVAEQVEALLLARLC